MTQRNRIGLWPLLLLTAAPALSCSPGWTGTETPPSPPGTPRRIVAVGDLHGDLEVAREALRLAGAIDEADHWAGGDMVLVQTGDILDRGDEEESILGLFQQLTPEAQNAGGEIHLLNGNHELMNAYLNFRYVTEVGFMAFGTGIEPTEQDSLLASLEEEERLRASAFRPGGPMAQRLSLRPITLILEDNLFVHAGILPEHLEMGLDSMNLAVRRWLRDEAPEPEWIKGDRSPVWTRLYSDQPTPAACDTLGAVLEALGVQRMVVGHTVQRTGITAYCGGRVWCIDVGMAAYYEGRPEVLEIKGTRVRSLR